MSGHRITDPAINMYAASKFAVNALTEGLRRELRQADTNIRVTVSMNKLCSSEDLLASLLLWIYFWRQ